MIFSSSNANNMRNQGTIAHVRLAAPTCNEVKAVLDRILEEENKANTMDGAAKAYLEEMAKKLVCEVNGDIRKAINILQYEGYLRQLRSHLLPEPSISKGSKKLLAVNSFSRKDLIEDDCGILSKVCFKSNPFTQTKETSVIIIVNFLIQDAVNAMASLLEISWWKSNSIEHLDESKAGCESAQEIVVDYWDSGIASTSETVNFTKSKNRYTPSCFSAHPTLDRSSNLECESFLEIMAGTVLDEVIFNCRQVSFSKGILLD